MCELSDFDWMSLTPYHRSLLEQELESWHREYLPVRTDARVVDFGAGCGETAWLYLNHGAQEVLCVEDNTTALACLAENMKRNRRFRLGVHLCAFRVDHVKLDIEGAEFGTVIEVHGPYHWQVIGTDKPCGSPYEPQHRIRLERGME